MDSAVTPDPRRWKALAVLGIAYLMVVLDVSIVNVALPSIQTDLDFSPEDLQWVVSGYALTFGGLLLLGGRAGDILGRRRIFMIGLALFSAFSLLCAVSQTDTMLIVARLLQGAAAALLAPSVFSIVDGDLPGGRRPQQGAGHPRRHRRVGRGHRRPGRWLPHRVLRLGVGLLGQRPDRTRHAALRPPVRAGEQGGRPGPQVRRPGCRDRHGEPDAPGLRAHEGQPGRLDVPGDDRRAGGLGGADGGLPDHRAAEPRTPSCRSASSSAARRRGRTSSGLVLGTVVFGMFYLLSLYSSRCSSYSAVETGVGYLAVALTAIVASGVAQALVTRIGVKPCLAFGMLCILVGLVWFTQISTDGTYFADLFGGFMLVGIGLGFSFVPVSIAALAGIPPRRPDSPRASSTPASRSAGRSASPSSRRSRPPTRKPSSARATPSSRRSPAASPWPSGWRRRSRPWGSSRPSSP